MRSLSLPTAGRTQPVRYLAPGDLRHGDAEVVLGDVRDQRRSEGIESPSLAQAVIVRVDLTSPLGRDHDGRVAIGLLGLRITSFGKTGKDLIDCRLVHPLPWFARLPGQALH